MCRVTSISLLVILLLLGGSAVGQDTSAEPSESEAGAEAANPEEPTEASDSQKALLLQADEALKAQNPRLAENLLQQAVDEAPLRSIYLRLAQHVASGGRCLEAQDHLRAAELAPPDQPEFELLASLGEVEAKLQSLCGQFDPVCLPGDVVIELAEGTQVACADKPFWVAPGAREIFYDFTAGKPSRRTVGIVKGETIRPVLVAASERRGAVAEATIYVSDAIPIDIANTMPEVEVDLDLEGPSVTKIAGWSFLGAGAIATVAGAVFAIQLGSVNEDARELAATDRFDANKAQKTLDDGRFFQAAELTSYGFAAAFLVTGGVLLWLDLDDEESALVPMLGPGQTGAAWVVQW